MDVLIRERTAELELTRDIVVMALANLAESRDPDTGEHLYRIQKNLRLLADVP